MNEIFKDIFKYSKIKDISILYINSVYHFSFTTHNLITRTILLDTEGLESLKTVKSISVNNTLGTIFITNWNKRKVNLSTYLFICRGVDRSDINRVLHNNGNSLDFRFCNLTLINTVNKPNFIFLDTSNLTPLYSYPKSTIIGFDRFVYYMEEFMLVEFRSDKNVIQTIVNHESFSDIEVTKMFPTYNVNLNEWRINYGYIPNDIPLPRFIMKYYGDLFIDHIDRNPLNNLVNNLRIADRSINGHNRATQVNNGLIKGVFYSDNRTPDGSYKYVTAFVTVNGVTQSRNFSIKELGLDVAIRMATELRREWNIEFNIEEE